MAGEDIVVESLKFLLGRAKHTSSDPHAHAVAGELLERLELEDTVDRADPHRTPKKAKVKPEN